MIPECIPQNAGPFGCHSFSAYLLSTSYVITIGDKEAKKTEKISAHRVYILVWEMRSNLTIK